MIERGNIILRKYWNLIFPVAQFNQGDVGVCSLLNNWQLL